MNKSRIWIQLGFLALTLIGVFIVKGNAERWCPFGGVEALYTYINEGNLTCSLGVSNFYVLGAVLVSVLLLRRAFCSYACPIGALSEWIQKTAKLFGIKPKRIPQTADKILSLLKYPLLALILFITWRASELLFRTFDPCYAVLSRHGEDITIWSYVSLGVVVLLSVFIRVPFCRWLCPLAAVLNPFSKAGMVRIKRTEEPCTSCQKCSKACLMSIPVHEVEKVTHARCTSCLECLHACPETEKGALVWGPGSSGFKKASAKAAVALVLLSLLGSAVAGSVLFPLPSFKWNNDISPPAKIAQMEIKTTGLNCRGSANLFVYFLERDDEMELPGYLKLEAWPGPDGGKAILYYDPGQTSESAIKMAITDSYYEMDADQWRASPFGIEGYDPLSLDGDIDDLIK